MALAVILVLIGMILGAAGAVFLLSRYSIRGNLRPRGEIIYAGPRDPTVQHVFLPPLPLLTHVTDSRAGDCLKASITSFAETVASFLPGHFEAYARLNHPPEATGSLPPDLIGSLIEHLEPATTTPDRCLFAVWEGFGGLMVSRDLEPGLDLPHRRYHVFTGPIAAAHTSFGVGPLDDQSANLWWPADQAWCVATEVDLSRTYVGGSRRCIEAILADPRLGAIETTAATPHD